MPSATTLRTPAKVVSRHWRAGCKESLHAQFGEGPTEKGCQQHLAGGLLYKIGPNRVPPASSGMAMVYTVSRQSPEGLVSDDRPAR